VWPRFWRIAALVANEWTDFGSYALGMLGGAVAGFVYEYVFQTPEEPHEVHDTPGERPVEAQQRRGGRAKGGRIPGRARPPSVLKIPE